jgi:hypothetical protein
MRNHKGGPTHPGAERKGMFHADIAKKVLVADRIQKPVTRAFLIQKSEARARRC